MSTRQLDGANALVRVALRINRSGDRPRGSLVASLASRHYARWIENGYREPLRLAEREVPRDLLARVSEPAPH